MKEGIEIRILPNVDAILGNGKRVKVNSVTIWQYGKYYYDLFTEGKLVVKVKNKRIVSFK